MKFEARSIRLTDQRMPNGNAPLTEQNEWKQRAKESVCVCLRERVISSGGKRSKVGRVR